MIVARKKWLLFFWRVGKPTGLYLRPTASDRAACGVSSLPGNDPSRVAPHTPPTSPKRTRPRSVPPLSAANRFGDCGRECSAGVTGAYCPQADSKHQGATGSTHSPFVSSPRCGAPRPASLSPRQRLRAMPTLQARVFRRGYGLLSPWQARTTQGEGDGNWGKSPAIPFFQRKKGTEAIGDFLELKKSCVS